MMKTAEIVFGTKNKAKIGQLQGALEASRVSIVGLDRFGEVPDVVEDGNTLMENAVKKAVTYAATIGQQVVSMDNGLYFDGLTDSEQPGIHLRRINGVDRTTDKELLAAT
jgi:XTP/dITP diphosphohydrolase